MITRTSKLAGGVAVFAAAAATTLVLGQGVANAGAVTTTVGAGILSTSLADASLSSTAFNFAEEVNSTGSVTVTSADARDGGAESLGFNVTMVTSSFVRTGGGPSIGASLLTNTSNGAPEQTAGLVVVGLSDAPTAVVGGGTLSIARAIQTAAVGTGNGMYEQGIDLNLEVPAETVPGTYTGTVTTTINSTPL